MKIKFYKSLLLLILFSVYFSIPTIAQKDDCKQKPNPYGLKVINCIEDYKKLVSDNPQMELIDLEKSIPGIVLDIRYATTDNFTKQVIYTEPRAFARKPVAEALKQVQDSLVRLGLGIKIYDAYRPYTATVKFYEVYPDTNFVANPRYGSRHNRGCAIDITLIDIRTKREIPMPTVFDEFSEKANPNYMDFEPEVIKNRTLLFNIMSHFGFQHYPTEWWHFDYVGWDKYPLLDISFDQLRK